MASHRDLFKHFEIGVLEMVLLNKPLFCSSNLTGRPEEAET